VAPRKRIVGSAPIYQFKVTLIGIIPPIWRRIHVAGAYTLAQFHRVLQVAMGWENPHLYMFRVGSKR
jgi:pRiA4b ORF-3-like protein